MRLTGLRLRATWSAAVVGLLALLLAFWVAHPSVRRTARPSVDFTVGTSPATERVQHSPTRAAGGARGENLAGPAAADQAPGFGEYPTRDLVPSLLSDEDDDEIAEIRKTFGVRVHVTYDADAYFPMQWKRAPISADGSQIEAAECRRAMRLIPPFLSSYPRELIATNLRDIYLLERMSFRGQEYGGTNSRAGIYIANKGEVRGYSDAALTGIMHAELSSILLRNYQFPVDEWVKVNAPDWKYLGEGYELVGRFDVFDQTEELLRQGFTRVYSQASVEEDVNGYVVAVVRQRAFLASAAARHTRVKQKLELLCGSIKE